MQTWLTEEVFKMKFIDVYGRFMSDKLTCEEAAELLGVSLSPFYRKRQRYEEEEEDIDAIFDRRIIKESAHRAADEEVEFLTRQCSRSANGRNTSERCCA